MCSINHNMLQELVTKLNISYDVSFKYPVYEKKIIKITIEGHNGNNIEHYLDKVIFRSSETFNETIICSPPYEFHGSFTYEYNKMAWFEIQLCYHSNENNSKRTLRKYLGSLWGQQIVSASKVYRIIHRPQTPEFREKLIKGGGKLVTRKPARIFNRTELETDDESIDEESDTELSEDDHENLKETVSKLEKDIAEHVSKLSFKDDTIHRLLEKNNRLERKLENVEFKVQSLQENLNKELGESSKMKLEKEAQLVDVTEQLKMRCEELKAEQLKTRGLTADLEAEKVKLNEVKQLLSNKNNTIEELEKNKQDESKRFAKDILDLKNQNIENLRNKEEEHASATKKLENDHKMTFQRINLELAEANNIREENLAKIQDLEKQLSRTQDSTETESNREKNTLVKELKKQISILEEEISQNKNCWVKVESLVEELDNVRKDMFEEKISNVKLNQHLSFANQKVIHMSAEQESSKNRISLLQKKLESLQSIISLNENKSKESVLGDDIKATLKEFKEFLSSEKKKDNVGDNEINMNLVKELEEMKTRNTYLERQVHEDKDTITNLKSKIEMKDQRIEELDRLLRFADNKENDLNNVIATKKELLDSFNIETTTGEIRAGAFQVMPSSRLVNQNDYLEMKEKLTESQSANQALKHILEYKDEEISDLNKQIEKYDGKNDQVNESVKQKEMLERKYKEQLEKLRADFKILTSHMIESLKKQNLELEAKLKQLEEESKKKVVIIKNLKTLSKQFRDKSIRLEEQTMKLEAALQVKEKEVLVLKEELTDANYNSGRKTGKLDLLKAHILQQQASSSPSLKRVLEFPSNSGVLGSSQHPQGKKAKAEKLTKDVVE